MEAMTADRDLDLEAIAAHYQALSALVSLRPIRSEHEYDRALATLNQLLDSGAADGDHPLGELVDLLGDLIATYEAVHYPLEDVPVSATLGLLMEQHGMTSEDLPESAHPQKSLRY